MKLTDLYPSDGYGECDGCHYERALWQDFSEEGEFMFCAECWQRMIDKHGEEVFLCP